MLLRTVIFLLIIQSQAKFLNNNKTKRNTYNTDDVLSIESDAASSRRVKESHRQSPLIDMLRMSLATNYAPNDPHDPFDFLRDSYPLPQGLKSPLKEYDYIIVGAGSAGCVLASRLTENPNVTVLVLEAGKPEMLTTDIPAIAPYFQRTQYTWPYYMEYQPGVCMGMLNRRCFWPRGKAVGGTSVINYMIYTRGRPQEWNRIEADGNYGWSYRDVLKYFKKSERANLRGLENSPYRGKTGKLYVEFVPTRTRLINAFLEAGRLLGHPTVDYNAPEKLGFGYVQTTTRAGHRYSAAKAFLHQHKNRPNLHILHTSVVTKLLIDSESKVALGVEYVRNHLKYNVRTRKELIISAGPIASPQLLMLSGIGPQEHLSNIGIPVIKDLPVGRTLYDHITFPGIIFKLNTSNVSFNEERGATIQNIFEWLQFGEGVLSTPGAVEGIGYIKTPISDDPEEVPDIELISIGGSLVSDGGPQGSKAVRKGMMMSEEIFDKIFGSIDNTDTWSAFPMLLHPKSKGFLELKDNNPFSFPKLYGNYLTDRRDVDTIIAAIRHVIALASTAPFKRLGARIHRSQYPTCLELPFNSDAYWECAIRTLTTTLHHQIATCRMGPASDSTTVVDPELRVHGVKSLRVVDTSIIPRTTSAHTNAPGMMIGEKAADLIKLTWNKIS